MAHKVILPKLGTNIDKATIICWLKKEGEVVSGGDMLFETETDKAVFQVESEYSGVLRKILYPEGSEISITKTVAIIANSDEDIGELEKQIREEEKQVAQTYAERTWKDWFAGRSLPKSESSDSEIRMSPAARRLAREKGADIQALARHFRGKKEVLELEDIEDFRKSEKVVIYGAGLGAKQALEIIHQLPNIEVVGLIDDNSQLKNQIIYGHKVLGGFDCLKDTFAKKGFASIALSFHSEVRRKSFVKLKKEMPEIPIKTLIDPRAIISTDVEIGEGVFIEAGAVIGPGVKLGDAVIIDLGVVVCHDCSIGAFSHLSPGCSLSATICRTS